MTSSVRRGCGSSCSCFLFLSTLSSRPSPRGHSHLSPFSASLLPLHHSMLISLSLFLFRFFFLLSSPLFSSHPSLTTSLELALATYPPICLPIYLSFSRSTAACRARHVHRREVEERCRLVRISSKLTGASMKEGDRFPKTLTTLSFPLFLSFLITLCLPPSFFLLLSLFLFLYLSFSGGECRRGWRRMAAEDALSLATWGATFPRRRGDRQNVRRT